MDRSRIPHPALRSLRLPLITSKKPPTKAAVETWRMHNYDCSSIYWCVFPFGNQGQKRVFRDRSSAAHRQVLQRPRSSEQRTAAPLQQPTAALIRTARPCASTICHLRTPAPRPAGTHEPCASGLAA
eukprot:66654-Chlamydomonas_euryale.AAC.1